MDVFDHEKHCSLCNQRDYLPSQCNHCKQFFCSDHLHYVDHSCNFFETEQNLASPEDIKIAKKRKSHVCASKGCSEKPLVKCLHCGNNTCVRHRFQELHQCTNIKPSTSASSIKNNEVTSPNTLPSMTRRMMEYLSIRKQRSKPSIQPSSQPLTNSSLREKLNLPTPLHKRTGKYVLIKRPSGHPLRFTNTRAEPAMPVYKPNLLEGDQVAFDIFFPLDTGYQPVHYVIQKSWKIGRLVDALCSQATIPRSLDKNSPSHLNLYLIWNGMHLPEEERIEDLIEKGILQQHDSIILERGKISDDILSPSVYMKLSDLCGDETSELKNFIELQRNWPMEIEAKA